MEMLVGGLTQMGPMNDVLDWVQIPKETGNFGSCPPHWKALGAIAVVYAKTAEPFGGLTDMGPTNHVLGGIEITHWMGQFLGLSDPFKSIYILRCGLCCKRDKSIHWVHSCWAGITLSFPCYEKSTPFDDVFCHNLLTTCVEVVREYVAWCECNSRQNTVEYISYSNGEHAGQAAAQSWRSTSLWVWCWPIRWQKIWYAGFIRLVSSLLIRGHQYLFVVQLLPLYWIHLKQWERL